MKRILIYGDSITRGGIANSLNRHDNNTRFTMVVQKELGAEYLIIENGQGGRMLKGENTHLPNRDGLKQFSTILRSHMPLDLVAIALGTNDVQVGVRKSPVEIADGLDDYYEVIYSVCHDMSAATPKVLIMSPPKIREEFLGGETEAIFINSSALAVKLPALYKQKADNHNAYFFDAAEYAEGSKEDGVHLDAENNIKLGKALAQKIKTII